jgi:hypothetical protein
LNDPQIHPEGKRKDTQTLSQNGAHYDRGLKPELPSYKAGELHTQLRKLAYAKFALVLFHNILIILRITASNERKKIECARYFIKENRMCTLLH